MAKSNWDTVTVLCKKGTKSKQAILAALGRGEDMETSKKWAAGQNKQHLTGKTTAKLDWETKELHHHWVTLEVVTKINKKPWVIMDYKSGQAILKNQVLGKIKRAWPQAPGEGYWEAN
ncbi:endothelial differentiation-related factor 1-like [Ursus arctos]|uniref:endothelial differentiation-related factor 1-like n=1 Tax=Ursus arctos TaxID=9644 RepID=UPI001CF8CAF3|nr:endothelial differentiation-related factor 1-like [Ursus arctos]